jgi:hypothetical protein
MDCATSPDLLERVNPTTCPKSVGAIDSATAPNPEFGKMQRIRGADYGYSCIEFVYNDALIVDAPLRQSI